MSRDLNNREDSSLPRSGGQVLQEEETASAKTQKQKFTGSIWRTEKAGEQGAGAER